MKLRGKVIEKPFGRGSKSEHEAVYLQTDKGEFLLRKEGSNPFENQELREFVGKEVVATGTLREYLFLVKTIELVMSHES